MYTISINKWHDAQAVTTIDNDTTKNGKMKKDEAYEEKGDWRK